MPSEPLKIVSSLGQLRMLWASWSIGTQTFWAMFLASSSLLLLGSLALSNGLLDVQQKQLNQNIDKRTALFSSSLIDALISEDTPVLNTSIEALAQLYPNLLGAQVCDYANQPLISWGSNVAACETTTAAQDKVTSALINTSRHDVYFSGEHFGQVALRWDISAPMGELNRQIIIINSSIAVAGLALMLLLFILVRRLVVRPIRSIDLKLKQVQGLLPPDLNHGFTTTPKSKELLALHQGVNHLQRSMESEAVLKADLTDLLASLEQQVEARTKDLSALNQQLSSITNNMGEALFLLDPQAHITVCNPAASHLLQLPEHYQGSALSEPFDEPSQARLAHLLDQPQETSCQLYLHSRLNHANTIIEATCYPIPLAVTTSHNQQKLVLMRDISLQEQQRHQQEQLAFQQGITELSVEVMHNIGNVLTGTLGHLENCREGATLVDKIGLGIANMSASMSSGNVSDEKLNKIASLLKQTSQQQLHLPLEKASIGISHISEIVHQQQLRSDTNQQVSVFSPTNLAQDLVDLFSSESAPSDINYQLAVEDGLREVALPRNQLFQCLANIIKNAIEAIHQMHSHPGQIKLGIQRGSHESVTGIVFTIEDNGIGLAANLIPQVFHMGYSTKDKGTGIGLHSCANFANGLDGSITVSSAGLNCGTCVRLWLPLLAHDN
mgnify:FL=1